MNTQEAIETVRTAVKQCIYEHHDKKVSREKLEQAWAVFEDGAMMSADDVLLLFTTLNEKINILTRSIHGHPDDETFRKLAQNTIDTYTKIMASVGAVPRLDEDQALAGGRMMGKLKAGMKMKPTVALEIEHTDKSGAGPS